ncbi:dephospho-CoA kinase [Undibacterium cyanobacteriorum]|uniref:Dephospho-CoA kinase n=1 Tax=Undibacterium cyanobacteriorum TaxID=3073561 RepID=A0ABY9RQ57_9BURK|nr:dephospho-CoA kinase [Undibacterium sp. 20NA77.5]WMW82121.1 dephospho-CoA kinase [Undibacterium sp. 20NA77.5]
MSTSARTRLVHLTGAIGSGKSTVRRLLEAYGVVTLDLDSLARSMHQDPQHPVMHHLKQAFPQLITTSGCLQRGCLRSYFSQHPDQNRELLRIMQPFIQSALQHWLAQQTSSFVVCETALSLVSDDSPIPVWRRVVVDASEALRLNRLLQRQATWTSDDATNMMAMQVGREAYLLGADQVISNDGDLSRLVSQVEELYSYLCNEGEIK